jgi:hypothetical protein
VNKYLLERYRDKTQLWYYNPTNIHLLRFIKMTLNRFCAEPTVLTKETDSHLQTFITLRIIIGKNESRLIEKVLKNFTSFVLLDWSDSTARISKIEHELMLHELTEI